MSKVGILLSGGIDSIALAYWKRPDVAYTVNYGQVCAQGEIRAASTVAKILGIPHFLLDVNCKQLGSGDLAGKKACSVAPVSEWWPFRNQLLITIVAMKAIQDGVETLLFGTVETDSTHCDGTVAFFQSMTNVLEMQEGGISVLSPAINLSSAELVKCSGIDGTVLAWAHSCHTSDFACGSCRGCNKHRIVMTELGFEPY